MQNVSGKSKNWLPMWSLEGQEICEMQTAAQAPVLGKMQALCVEFKLFFQSFCKSIWLPPMVPT